MQIIEKYRPQVSSVPPLRAAAVSDDLYKPSAHVCKQNVAGFVGGQPNPVLCSRSRVYYQRRKIMNFDLAKKIDKSA